MPGQTLERLVNLDVHEIFHYIFEQLLEVDEYVLLLDKRHLHVDLRELGLAVGAQILVAEAARDLIVFVDAADHQKLLVNLRRLRQCVELAGVNAARDKVVARALGRRFHHHRCFYLDKAVVVKVERVTRTSS